MTEKICNRCKKSLLLDSFGTNKNTGHLNKTCISCTEKYKCLHGKQKPTCKTCKGSQICKHDKRKSECKVCGGGSICEHDKHKSYCKICKGSQVCPHERRKSTCRDCGGGSICEHNKQKRCCKICDPQGYIASIVRSRVTDALKYNKEMASTEYLGCDIKTFKAHIEAQFKDGMTWENHGEWHIDHKIPLKYKHNGETPSLEEVAKRLHYTNTQPMWASENIAKGNRYVS